MKAKKHALIGIAGAFVLSSALAACVEPPDEGDQFPMEGFEQQSEPQEFQQPSMNNQGSTQGSDSYSN